MSKQKSGGSSEHNVFNHDHLKGKLQQGIHQALTAIEHALDNEIRICQKVLEWLEGQAKQNTRAKTIHERIMTAATA